MPELRVASARYVDAVRPAATGDPAAGLALVVSLGAVRRLLDAYAVDVHRAVADQSAAADTLAAAGAAQRIEERLQVAIVLLMPVLDVIPAAAAATRLDAACRCRRCGRFAAPRSRGTRPPVTLDNNHTDATRAGTVCGAPIRPNLSVKVTVPQIGKGSEVEASGPRGVLMVVDATATQARARTNARAGMVGATDGSTANPGPRGPAALLAPLARATASPCTASMRASAPPQPTVARRSPAMRPMGRATTEPTLTQPRTTKVLPWRPEAPCHTHDMDENGHDSEQQVLVSVTAAVRAPDASMNVVLVTNGQANEAEGGRVTKCSDVVPCREVTGALDPFVRNVVSASVPTPVPFHPLRTIHIASTLQGPLPLHAVPL